MNTVRPLLIRPRRDTYENFAEANLVYRTGEMLVVRKGSVNRYKVGDGVRPFLELPYVSCEHMLSNGKIYAPGYTITIDI